MTDPVNHPEHYTKGNIEVIDIIEDIARGYDPVTAVHIGQVIKYIGRAPYKENTRQDLEKARWYLERAITYQDRLSEVVSEFGEARAMAAEILLLRAQIAAMEDK